MVNVEDLNNKYKPIEDLEENAYFEASKVINDYVENNTSRKWSQLTKAQKLEAAEKFTEGVNNAALNFGMITMGNEYGRALVGNPGEFTDEYRNLILKNPIDGLTQVYKHGIGTIVGRMSNVIPNSINESDINGLKTEFRDLLNINPNKVETKYQIVKLWNINYNKIKGDKSLDEQLADFR